MATPEGVNGVTGATAETTTYDRIFSTLKALEAIMEKRNLSDPSKVTASMLAEAYRKGGDSPPSSVQLCGNKRLALGFSTEAFKALKIVSESDDPAIDVQSLSKNLLDHHCVTNDLKAHPLEQSFLIHILARYKKHNKKAPLKENLQGLKTRVMQAGAFYRQIESVIPRDSWSPDFDKAVTGLIYGRQNEWEIWGYGHMIQRNEEVAGLQELLPRGKELSEEHVGIIKGKLNPRLEKAAKEHPDLQRHLETWAHRMSEVNKFIDINKNCPDDPSSGSSPSSEESDEEKDGSGDPKPVLCDQCEPPGATGFCCPKCGMHHVAWCEVTETPDDVDSTVKERPCLRCPNDQPPSKKRKKNAVQTLPIDDNAEVETSMSRNTTVHPEELFVGRTKAYNGGTPMKVLKPPKLAMVDLTRETHLFKNTESSNRSLKVVLQSVLDTLHPQGTMAFAIPRPWLTAGLVAGGAFKDLVRAVLQPTPLLVQYQSVAGGSVKNGHENFFRNQTEQIAILHRPFSAEKPFTCNKRVVASDVFGHSTGRFPHPTQVVHLESLPAGAPDGGSRSFFPPKVAQLLIGRFTNVTDTVLGIGVETTTVAEDAIEKGRCVEFYVTDNDKRAILGTKIEGAFRTAHGRGMFQSRLGAEAVVGPKVLPSGLSRSTVPLRITELLEKELERAQGDRLLASFKAAQQVAKDSDYELKGEEGRNGAELRGRKKKRGASNSPADLPVWGEFIVYTTPEEARSTLQVDEVDEQFVRLIQVADNAQLRLMLEAGVESCGTQAALYLRVDPTCPIYWVRWENRKSKADLDIVSDIPRRGTRSVVLQNVVCKVDGKGGVKIRYARNMPSETTSSSSLVSLLINTACARIVGPDNFPPGSSSRRRVSSGDGDEEEEEEEEEEGEET